MRYLPALAILLFLLMSGLAQAGEEQQINELLKNGGNITLENRVYEITGPIYIHSNTILTGSPDTIIRVSSSSSQWFTGSTAIICNDEVLNNVEIYGFSIDGNVENLPKNYDHSRPGTDHDCENLIRFQGDSNNFMNNIKVHDMRLYDSFGDGCHIIFCNNAEFYNNLISNTQHEGFFGVCCIDSKVYNNHIAGITSDCLRLDNSIRCKVYDNVLFSYNGTHADNAYLHGENGLQVGNGGVSHGYNARNKPTSTKNIEVFNNTFADNGLQAILLDSMALAASANIFIHDNKFIGKAELETMGIPVDIGDNVPTKEMSEKVFSSILNILNTNVTNTEHINTYKNIETVHAKAVNEHKDKPLIPKTTYLFITIVGIFILGSRKVLKGII